MFCIISQFGKVGRAALRVMRDSAARGDTSIDVRPDVRPAIDFLYKLIDKFPRFTIPAFPRKRKPIYIWSDAMFVSDGVDGINYSKEPVKGCFGRIGFIAIDLQTNSATYSFKDVEEPLLDELFHKSANYIGELETLGAAVPYYSLAPHINIQDRNILHFVDNQGALWALTRGDCRGRNSARIVHALAEQQLALRVGVWYEYVESAANIADLPGRLDFSFVADLASQFNLSVTYVPSRLSEALPSFI